MKSYNFLLYMVILLLSSGATVAAVPGDENWADLFGQAELEGDILAMASTPSQTQMYVGGNFARAGELTLNGVALWDGTSWSSLGTGANAGVDGIVYAIAVDGTDVYVGGKFTKAGGVAANNIARWDAAAGTWNALGTGVGGDPSAYVGSITIVSGNVYVGGWFSSAGAATTKNIARWNKSGGSWASLGAGAANGINGDVLALDIKDSLLYVGGSFNRAGGVVANNIVRWNLNRQEWQPIVDKGINGIDGGYVNVITVALGEVFVGGQFLKNATNEWIGNRKVGGDTAINIIRWTGTAWHALSNTYDQDPGTGGDGRQIYGGIGTNSVVRAITTIGDTVYVGGTFKSARPETISSGDAGSPFVIRYEGMGVIRNVGWSSMKGGVNGYVNALSSMGKNLFVGGTFTRAGGESRAHIARWNVLSNAWSGLTSGPSGNIAAVALHGANVYVSGLMAAPDGQIGYRIARWEGTKWSTFNTTVSGPIYTMAIGGDNIYVGGMFTRAAAINATNVARYNLTTNTWSSLGAGVGGIGETYVSALAYKGTTLYAGGDFDIADDVLANGIAMWNGTKWSAIGTGVNGWINAIAIADNGDIYVGGDFSVAGGVQAKNIARWDGTKWNALGTGASDVVRAIAISGTNVYVGGDFGFAGTATSRAIAMWNGTQWVSMGNGMQGGLFPAVNTIAVSGTSVYAAGTFLTAGGVPALNIARWDGTNWNPLGSGADGQVRAMVIRGTSLFAGGDFDNAGGKPSYKFGEWTAVPNSIKQRDGDGGLPTIAMFGGSPNPASGLTTIRFSISDPSGTDAALKSALSESSGTMRVTIHDAIGRTVATLADELPASGEHAVEWDASNAAEGVYFCRVEYGGRSETGRIVVQR
jgi:hypothetical protein